jgi:arsenate reductase-like glutaredoxin family protein
MDNNSMGNSHALHGDSSVNRYLPSFKILQEAVYELTKPEYDAQKDRQRTLQPFFRFRELIERSVKELNLYLHTKTRVEVHEMVHNYLHCVTILANQVYEGQRHLLVNWDWEERAELIRVLCSNLLDIIKNVQYHWHDCNPLALPVPRSVFEEQEEKNLCRQVKKVLKVMRAGNVNPELSAIVAKPLHSMAFRFLYEQLSWQRMYYNKQLMKQILYLHDQAALNTQSLLDLLMEYNFNHPDLIRLYIKHIKAELSNKRATISRKKFLTATIADAKIWQIPEYKGLNPNESCLKDRLLPSLEELLKVQLLQEQEDAEKKSAGLPVNPVVKRNVKLMAWLAKDFKENMLDKSVSQKEANDALSSILAIDKSVGYLCNAASKKMDQETYDLASDIADNRQVELDKEWKATGNPKGKK